MTQEQANHRYNLYKNVVEQQKKEEIELAKSECNLRQEQYREQLKEAKQGGEQAELAQKIKDAESYRDNKIQEIESKTNGRLADAEQRLKETVEQTKLNEAKQQEVKIKQDQELRQEKLSNDQLQKQRDELDKKQEQAKQDNLNDKIKADNSTDRALMEDLKSKQAEIERRREELERQRELNDKDIKDIT